MTRAVRAALFAVRIYQAYLSPLFGGSCRFQPTCSQYAHEAIERFGLAPGARLALWRLLHCHPFSRAFGFDPVPEPDEANSAGPKSTAAQANQAAAEVRS